MNQKKYHFETLQLHAGQEQPDSATDARAVPIYASTSYVFKNCAQATARFDLSEPGYIYSRLGNPTTAVFEERVAALEGGIGALATASGAAATAFAIQNLARHGDHIVSAQSIYGGTYNLFAHTFSEMGISTTFVRSDDYEGYEQAIRSNTKAVFIESIGNPNANLVDITRIAEIAHKHAIPLVIDNTFATPYLIRPFEHGADIIIHSATKFMGGHGTSIGGIIVDSGRFDWKASGKFPQFVEPDPSYHGISFTTAVGAAAYIVRARVILQRDIGATISPFNSFLFLQGLETLSLRVERHVSNALQVVRFLANHPKVERVNHPSLPGNPSYDLYQRYFPRGGASIFTVVLKGGAVSATRFIDRLQIFSLLANVADVKSLVIHPASTTHSQMNAAELQASGIEPGSVRLSVGTEHIEDLLEDLRSALED